MANYYGCSKDKILDYAKEIGYINKLQGKLDENQKQEIINQYHNKTSTELAKQYNVSRGQITKIWYDNNLIGKDIHEYPFDYNYFEIIDTPDKAYFLGFLAADGNVYKRDCGNSQSIIKLALKSEDKYILEIFKYYLDSQKPLHTHQKENTDYISYIYSLELVSNKMAADLSKYNIIPCKTYVYDMPLLKDELMSHYFRGYFDGDGSIFCNNSMFHSPSYYHINITGFVHNLEKMKRYLSTKNINSVIVIENRKEKQNKHNIPFGNLRFTNTNERYKFIKYIYQDKRDIYLCRKEYIANCFINAIEQNYSNRQTIYDNILMPS